MANSRKMSSSDATRAVCIPSRRINATDQRAFTKPIDLQRCCIDIFDDPHILEFEIVTNILYITVKLTILVSLMFLSYFISL